MEKYKINEAIDLLKKGYNLISDCKDKSIFGFNQNTYFIKTDSTNISLNESDFINIFKDTIFIIYEHEEFEVNSAKDEEYYAFKHK